ncbi:Ni/Fe-hydrogenase, b-type cytochrome subunit [Rhodospirillum rubrum]|uniref:Ni/Fe-hydrogenase, b-type cytochrome subunit n=1 Tax=Rhodospirillum rubrum TaxID=1085 RepID=UPI0019083FFF|nr:Ni/Fe-hydrogenase, b-type cytochrome subunit [Rhodospirillum rubrum]MBK1664273.1 Ni/Fe-hydrogenase, b-type cytochrome subunit [Rhodospirillum rubrum]MBK1675932.1 Ni/Fe-hydrogenase, b-type cytochrome subunit [Rhodospirillum rubrum]
MSTVTDEAAPEVILGTTRHPSVYIYEAPVRLWHWLNAACIVVLAVTGYLIGSPPPSLAGDAGGVFRFGALRFAHFAAGLLFAGGFVFRAYWAFVGNHYARQLFVLPFWRAVWWREIWFELSWYLFLRKEPKKYLGHNPLAHFMMFFLFTLVGLFMIVSGMALYAEGQGSGSWTRALFGWVFWLFPNTQDLRTLHHLGLWAMACFTMLHVYAAIREDIMSRQSMLSTMISGRRMFKDDRP